MSLDLQKGRVGDREVAPPEREYRIKVRVVMWISSYVGICNEASEFFSARSTCSVWRRTKRRLWLRRRTFSRLYELEIEFNFCAKTALDVQIYVCYGTSVSYKYFVFVMASQVESRLIATRGNYR
jgi:hypothetical protein